MSSLSLSPIEIDTENLTFATRQIERNNLHSRIRLLFPPTITGPTDPTDLIKTELLFPFAHLPPTTTLDFTLCNPPFYSSLADLEASAAAKSRPPSSACTGAPIEMVTPGGEVHFVRRLVAESARKENRDRCRWYTSMLGKYSSVPEIIDAVRREAGVGNYAVTEFAPGQGKKTRRWAVGWSFLDWRPAMRVARGCPSLAKSLLPFPVEFDFHTRKNGGSVGGEAAASGNGGGTDLVPEMQRLITILAELALPLTVVQQDDDPPRWAAVVTVAEDVWSRAARRKRKRRRQQQQQATAQRDSEEASQETTDRDCLEKTMTMVIKITLTEEEGFDDHDNNTVQVMMRWIKGIDSVLFESFCGMIKREMG